MNLIAQNRTASDLWKTHILAKMRAPRCWICTEAIREVRSSFFWFTSEQYYEPEVVDKLRLAHGFCPAHTGHFLETGANSVITAVYSYLTWYVIKQLNAARDLLRIETKRRSGRELCLQAAALLKPQGICPMCLSLQGGEQINVHALTQSLALGDVREAYEKSSGLCLPHFRKTANGATWDTVSFLNEDMQRRLKAITARENPSTALLEQAVGVDKEISGKRRANGNETYRSSNENGEAEISIDLGQPEARWSPTFEQLLASLAEPGCPVCNACKRGVRRYLDWLARQMDAYADGSTPSGWESSYAVCPAHLWALYSAGYERAAVVNGKHMIEEWLSRLSRLSAGLRFRPSEGALQRLRQGLLVWCGAENVDFGADWGRPPSRRQKIAAVLVSPQARLDGLREIAFRGEICEACSHIRTVTRQSLDLILRAMEDPAGRKAYHAASGLCLRHCVEAAGLAEVPAALTELLSAQIARLRLLEWELGEASRKIDWSVRYEAKGPEGDAWRRAAYQFCGV